MLAHQQFIESAERASQKGALKLLELVTRKGKFIYLYDHKTGARPKDYNLVRHAGSVWAMLSVADQLKIPSSIIFPVARSAFQWLIGKYAQRYLPKPGDTFWYGQPNFWLGINWHGSTTLGANALTLLAMSEMCRQVHETGSTEDLAIMDAINALMYGVANMYQYEADSFVHKWDAKTLMPINFTSDYYVGEALFAVLHWQHVYQKIFPGADSMHDAIRSQMLKHMIKLAGEKYGLEFQSHWMMYAVSHALLHWRFEFSEEGQDLLVNYLTALVTDVLDRTQYRKGNRSTPIACRTEGMMAAMQVFLLPEINRDKKYAQFIERIMNHAQANIMLQMGFVQDDGAVIRGGAEKGYNEVRIDYIQHNISSFAAFANVVKRLPKLADLCEDKEC